jgi:hypothetical protein
LSGKCTDIISLGTGLLGRHALLAGSWHVDVSLQIVDLRFFNVGIYVTERLSSSSSSLEAAAKGELMSFKAVVIE